jgi:hypothetical protein
VKLVSLFLCLALLGTARSAAAAGQPTKQECAAANESAQDLRGAGKLRDARTALATCTSASCPGPIREDCAQRLSELEAAQPTVVFDAKSTTGQDLTAVRVTVDERRIVETLDGVAIPLDPGKHNLVFEADGFRRNTALVVVHEGERGRRVRVVLQADTPATPPQAPPVVTPKDEGSTQRTVGLSLGAAGGVGVVVGAVFGVLAKVTYDHAETWCPGGVHQCSPTGLTDGKTAYTEATVSDVAFVVGGALLASGIAFYFTAPGGREVALSGATSNGGGGLSARMRW